MDCTTSAGGKTSDALGSEGVSELAQTSDVMKVVDLKEICLPEMSMTVEQNSESDSAINVVCDNSESTTRETSEEVVERFSTGMDQGSDNVQCTYTAPASQKYPVVFRWRGEGKDIFVSGSYDNWATKAALVRSESHFYTVVDVPLGSHEYKYFVDGEWKCDGEVTKTESVQGIQNNLLTIKKADYNVMSALSSDDFVCTSPYPSSWNQSIPFHNSGTGYTRIQPPSVPPYLVDCLLNKELASSIDPNLLPQPHMVLLNHLYTLSIKDGCIVLCATCRYRRKYITTVLYKPL